MADTKINEEFKAKQIERIQKLEEEEQFNDSLMRREYDDDYDDQYDGYRGVSVESGGNNVKSWHKRMEEMKRINQLVRADEAESKFWEDMRNTNRKDLYFDSHQESDTNSEVIVKEEDEVPSKLKSQNQNKPQGAPMNAAGTRKLRNKKFDKHRQQNKSIKKQEW